MLRMRMLKRVVIILLILSMVYANASTAILGAVTYAVENKEEAKTVIEIPRLEGYDSTEQEENSNSSETEIIIEEAKTVAKLGIDKQHISTSVENKVNFTITMATEKNAYNLYKNPEFIIELPEEVKTVNVQDVVILNNQYFEIETIGQETLDNGNQAIKVKLKGEQTEYTKSMEENTQILIEATITTEKLIPSITTEVKLHYQNECEQNKEGTDTIQVDIVSNNEVIVATKATVGTTTIESIKGIYKDITIEPNTHKYVQIAGTAINNTGADITNAVILGSATNFGRITGVDKVYYTENENATADLQNAENMWSENYTENAKKYLIIINNFAQGQTVIFSYVMTLPENIEEDKAHVAKFEVYNNQSDKVLRTSKITINQKAEKQNVAAGANLKAEVVLGDTKNLQAAGSFNFFVNVTNQSNVKAENVEIEVKLPSSVLIDYVYGDDSDEAEETNGEIITYRVVTATVNENAVEPEFNLGENSLKIAGLNISGNETITVEIQCDRIGDLIEGTQKIETTVDYEGNKIKLYETIFEASEIEATFTSDKQGQVLQANEKINYTLTLENKGPSNSRLKIDLPELIGVNIRKIEINNLTTGETSTMTGVALSGTTYVALSDGDIVQINMQAVAKELKKDTTEQTVYANISGERANPTTTNELVNRINKKAEVTTVTPNQDGTKNVIKGVAWLDGNQNGQRDAEEVLLKDIQAVLIETESSAEVATEVTNSKGEYEFNNVPAGNYVVEFRYNTNTFSLTEYKKEGISEELDSDVVATTQDNKTTAKTEVISLSGGKTEIVNAGFIANKQFDLSINKGITNVTVDNGNEIKTYDFKNSNLAKVEINGEYFKGSLVLVEYEITVKNEGDISGYAELISYKVPEGMEFKSELNPEWYEESDGTLYCESLTDTEIAPGEAETIKLVLATDVKSETIQLPESTVTIEEEYNEYLIADKNEENNAAKATIIISLTTGNVISYVWLAVIFVSIIVLGVFGVIRITKKNAIKIETERRK